MTWISKNLTLDLLAIGIDAMQKTFDRIKEEPDTQSPWPKETPATASQAVQESPAAPKTEPAAAPAPAPAPKPQEEETTPDLLPEAQNLLRSISMNEGPTWITSTLFPHFHVQSLTDVPANKLPELITMAQQHQQKD